MSNYPQDFEFNSITSLSGLEQAKHVLGIGQTSVGVAIVVKVRIRLNQVGKDNNGYVPYFDGTKGLHKKDLTTGTSSQPKCLFFDTSHYKNAVEYGGKGVPYGCNSKRSQTPRKRFS